MAAPKGAFVGQHVGAVVCLAYAPDGKSVASAGEDGHVVLRSECRNWQTS